MDFVATLRGFAEFRDEFGVLTTALVRFIHCQEFPVEFVPAFVERFLHSISPLRFLATEPRPKTGLSWLATFAPTPRRKL